MTKPLGLTAGFRVVKPTRAEDQIWNAVEEAISEGMTVSNFIREAREAWEHELREVARRDDGEFVRIAK